MKIRYTLSPGAHAPTYATDGSAGMDLYSRVDDIIDAFIRPVPTGVFVAIPSGYGLLILPRSGMAIGGCVVANSPGLIDSDYRGEINILLRKMRGRLPIYAGDRIAQMVLVAMPRIELEPAESLDDTARGSGGFGSTGS